MDNPNQMFHGETTEPERQILLPLTPAEYQFLIDCLAFYLCTDRGEIVSSVIIRAKLRLTELGSPCEAQNDLFHKLNKITQAIVPPEDTIAI